MSLTGSQITDPRTTTRAALLPNSIRATLLSLSPFLSLSRTHTDASLIPCTRWAPRVGQDKIGTGTGTGTRTRRPAARWPTTERTKLPIYLWFGGLPRAECGVCPPRAHRGTLRLVIVFVCRVRVYTRGLARSLARPFTAARSFRPLVLSAIRPRSALVGCHPARHGGNPGLSPGPSSAGRREGESNAEGERGRRDLVGLSREAGSPMHVCRGTG